VRIVLEDIKAATAAWIKGQPHSEEALMNQLTGRLSRRRKGCDVGLRGPVNATAQVALLHRKGVNNTDKYGADLAVTIRVDNDRYMKTALFQLKRGSCYQVIVESQQLQDAYMDKRLGDRSFVLAIDDNRLGIHIKDVKTLLAVKGDQKTKTHSFHDWTFLTKWLYDWLSCEVGPVSDFNDSNGVEPLLESYVVDEQNRESPWGSITSESDQLQNDVIPARVWLTFFLNSQASDLS
jgi:hypothetical protein